ncbi:MAG: uracil-DNA glycosylase [Pseudomonadota bacterium]
MKTPKTFVSALSEIELSDTFNPYRDRCSLYDHSDAPRRRRQNLQRCLEATLDYKADTIWVARDLGYRGGRRTGLPLTDEAHLEQASSLFGGADLQRATKGNAVAERTATVTWGLLSEIGRPVMLWNVFPLHPHGRDDPMTNRCHRKSEREATWPFLIALIRMIRPQLLVAIGRDAGNALTPLEQRVETVRHPSYGGQADFISGIRSLYALPSEDRSERSPALPFVEFA